MLQEISFVLFCILLALLLGDDDPSSSSSASHSSATGKKMAWRWIDDFEFVFFVVGVCDSLLYKLDQSLGVLPHDALGLPFFLIEG